MYFNLQGPTKSYKRLNYFVHVFQGMGMETMKYFKPVGRSIVLANIIFIKYVVVCNFAGSHLLHMN